MMQSNRSVAKKDTSAWKKQLFVIRAAKERAKTIYVRRKWKLMRYSVKRMVNGGIVIPMWKAIVNGRATAYIEPAFMFHEYVDESESLVYGGGHCEGTGDVHAIHYDNFDSDEPILSKGDCRVVLRPEGVPVFQQKVLHVAIERMCIMRIAGIDDALAQKAGFNTRWQLRDWWDTFWITPWGALQHDDMVYDANPHMLYVDVNPKWLFVPK